jgi:UDP-3-O-[3-hydroxymyristoyl] N-acetylglucosamine deacetylase/3-hydroxyacyl-[acyl-carrier-protein] dehydratase
MDGSSRYFVEALEKAGIKEQNAEKEYITIKEEIKFEIPDKKIFVSVTPADKFSVEVEIDYETKVLGKQYAYLEDISNFKTEIAPCRTFVFLHELEFLLNNNLIKGGDISNAIVFVNKTVEQEELDRLAKLFNKPKVKVKKRGILNNVDLHFENEPARHKLLDLVGDLTLLGKNIKGHIKASRPGHYTNTEFAKQIKKKINNYE